MLDSSVYEGIIIARNKVAKLLILGYPDVKRVSDVPQDLVSIFDALTDLLLCDGEDENNGIARSSFDYWWSARRMLKVRWANE